MSIYIYIYSKILLRASGVWHASRTFLQLNMIFKLLLLFWTAQAWPRRTFGSFGLRRRGPDELSADKLLFWIAPTWPRRTLGYFGLRRRGPGALSADNSFSGSRYYAGESSDFDVLYFYVFL